MKKTLAQIVSYLKVFSTYTQVPITANLHTRSILLFKLGLGSIGKTLSARESLTIDTHHPLTSSDKLDTLPPNPTSFEPLPNSLVPPPPKKNSQEPTLCFYFSKKTWR